MKLKLTRILKETRTIDRALSGEEAFAQWARLFSKRVGEIPGYAMVGAIRDFLRDHLKTGQNPEIVKHYGKLSPEDAKKFLDLVTKFDARWVDKKGPQA